MQLKEIHSLFSYFYYFSLENGWLVKPNLCLHLELTSRNPKGDNYSFTVENVPSETKGLDSSDTQSKAGWWL